MSDKMKIIFLGPSHPYRGGIATFSDRLAMECQQSGHAVELITFSLQYPSVLFPGKTQFADEPKPHDLSVRRMINSINPFSWIKTGRYIQSQKPDLVIVRYWIPFLAPALGTILRLTKSNKFTKVICIADNIHPHESRWGDRILTHYFNTPVDGYVLMSEEVKKDFLSLGFNKPYVVQPLGMDAAKPVLLFFGLIRKYKGLDLLLEAMANERIRATAVQLLIAGECYEDSEKYHSLIQRLNLSDRVRFINTFIPNDQVALYFSAADALVQPYRHASQSGVDDSYGCRGTQRIRNS
jgi:D-inositol-3-phosphate glycosyltransferase